MPEIHPAVLEYIEAQPRLFEGFKPFTPLSGLPFSEETLARVDSIVRVGQAIETANKWVETAEPIIRAMFQLEDAVSDLQQHVSKHRENYRDTEMSRTYDEPRKVVAKAQETLAEIIEGIRDNALCDVFFHHDSEDSADVEDRKDRENKEVAERVISYDQAIALVTDKVNHGA